ncbi:UNVERIFIED_CONTAM: hypothetical protein FKN15_072947 [Acipenser sinensis]
MAGLVATPGEAEPPATPCEAGPSMTPGEAEPPATPCEAGPSMTPGEAEPPATPCEAGPSMTPGEAEPPATPCEAGPSMTPGEAEPPATPCRGLCKTRPNGTESTGMNFTGNFGRGDRTALWQGCFNLFDDIVMETLCLTTAFGFLRCAEFSTLSTSSFPALGLKRSDLSQIPGNHFIIHIRSSKTVQLSQGFSIFRRIPSSSTAPDLYLRDTGSHPVYAPSCHGSDFLQTISPPIHSGSEQLPPRPGQESINT